MIGVVGLGNWGTALAEHLARSGHQVLAWDRDTAVIEGISNTRRNPKYQHDALLTPTLEVTHAFEDLFQCDTLLVVVPSNALRDLCSSVLAVLGDSTFPKTVVSAVKGFEPQSAQTPVQFLTDQLRAAAPHTKFAVLSGPSFAADIISAKPSGLVAASREEQTCRDVARLFSSESMKVYVSRDVTGVELGGILKNVIAIAVGISDGLDLGDSARAGLVTRGLAEVVTLAEHMGAQRETLFGLSGLGDLVMTATCDISRNRTVGLRLGRGESLSDIIESLGSVAEGVKTAPLILALAKKHQVEMPICEHVLMILEEKLAPREVIGRLLSRPIREEF